MKRIRRIHSLVQTGERPLRKTSGPAARAFTLIELLVVVAIIAILAAIGVVNYRTSQTRARVAATVGNIRSITTAMESYHVDNGAYPSPAVNLWDDPFGVVAETALSSLTTPIAYIGSAAFYDSFGAVKFESSIGGTDMFGLPISTFNSSRSLLIFSYPEVARLVTRPAMNRDGYAIASPGPDSKDSFIVYYPFPNLLPASAAAYGIGSVSDTIYDPTNGTSSSGDIAGFGGDLNVPKIVGGGIH
ncbi:prepilin-type N-terminal cleavage/methylation domain-containing protein [Candidatus Sumerlaeota bacterium]|nr:prepilin-type N-terminal cleavage/methylation domain-containing protein [Candidatus Sumerlaeota bacterium]